ncbi:MAG TPA: hypothetical protein VIV11_42290 [Kofleriaceae bacterium]
MRASEEPPSPRTTSPHLLEATPSATGTTAPPIETAAYPDESPPSATATPEPPVEAVRAHPDETPSVLWGDSPLSLSSLDEVEPADDMPSVLWGDSPPSLSSFDEIEPAVEQPAAPPAPEPDLEDEQQEPEPYEEKASHEVAPRRSWGGALFSLFLLLVLAAAGVLAFKWLQADVQRQGTGSDVVDPSETASGAHR